MTLKNTLSCYCHVAFVDLKNLVVSRLQILNSDPLLALTGSRSSQHETCYCRRIRRSRKSMLLEVELWSRAMAKRSGTVIDSSASKRLRIVFWPKTHQIGISSRVWLLHAATMDIIVYCIFKYMQNITEYCILNIENMFYEKGWTSVLSKFLQCQDCGWKAKIWAEKSLRSSLFRL